MYDDRYKEIVKGAKDLARKLLSENAHSKVEIVKQVWTTYKCAGFGLKEAKDVVDEMQDILLHSTKNNERMVAVVNLQEVRQDIDLYLEIVEKIEGLEAQIRLITEKYPYIKFPRYAREPSQPTTQK